MPKKMYIFFSNQSSVRQAEETWISTQTRQPIYFKKITLSLKMKIMVFIFTNIGSKFYSNSGYLKYISISNGVRA